jgi:hypothetical protein
VEEEEVCGGKNSNRCERLANASNLTHISNSRMVLMINVLAGKALKFVS